MENLKSLDDFRTQFLAHVHQPSPHECWEWYVDRRVQHGQVGFRLNGVAYGVANAMWYYVYGTYPLTTFRRTCGNPRCANPLHLYDINIAGRQHRFDPGKGVPHMSMYCEVKTQFKNQDCLIAAMMETHGWTQEQIEVHTEAQPLIGYQNDARPQKAHIIVRRVNVGTASNDLGFERQPDGSFVAHISEYDRNRYNDQWINNLKGNYAFHVVARQQQARGRTVQRERLPDGRQRVSVISYR